MRGMVPRIRELGVIANPLPPELPDRALAARVRDARGRYRLMAMGRLVPAKQFDLLIGAFAELAGEFPAWDLAIWGEGPMRDALTEQIRRAGMRHRGFLPGRTSEPWTPMKAGPQTEKARVGEGGGRAGGDRGGG